SASEAVRSFMHLVRYAEAREMLMAAPPSLPAGFTTDSESARRLVRGALDSGRTWLNPGEIAELLACYGIKQAPGRLAATPREAEILARGMLMQAERLALKLVSPQLPFKSDVGGVVLDLASPEAVRIAAATLL